MSADEFLAKARQAARSAKLLLSAGDTNGASNRAYYAMFDAARAGLSVLAPENNPGGVRTHKGLIAEFGVKLVKAGFFPVDMGRMLNRAQEVRLVADYNGDAVELADAKELVESAERFVTAIDDEIQKRRARLSGIDRSQSLHATKSAAFRIACRARSKGDLGRE